MRRCSIFIALIALAILTPAQTRISTNQIGWPPGDGLWALVGGTPRLVKPPASWSIDSDGNLIVPSTKPAYKVEETLAIGTTVPGSWTLKATPVPGTSISIHKNGVKVTPGFGPTPECSVAGNIITFLPGGAEPGGIWSAEYYPQ